MWRAALSAGISPDVFWSLSLREWRWLSGNGQRNLQADGLKALMETFPDD